MGVATTNAPRGLRPPNSTINLTDRVDPLSHLEIMFSGVNPPQGIFKNSVEIDSQCTLRLLTDLQT